MTKIELRDLTILLSNDNINKNKVLMDLKHQLAFADIKYRSFYFPVERISQQNFITCNYSLSSFSDYANVLKKQILSDHNFKWLQTFYSYLFYQAIPGDYVFIEEPELGMHPETVVKIIELLTMLANEGLKIIITVNSVHYQHLETLSFAATIKNIDHKLFYLKNLKSVISLDKISIYEIKNANEILDLKIDNKINIATFWDVGRECINIYKELLKSENHE